MHLLRFELTGQPASWSGFKRGLLAFMIVTTIPSSHADDSGANPAPPAFPDARHIPEGCFISSLAYLARFPANGLKIDKSFVRAMDSGAGMAIVEATVAIANALNMKVTAEGVETAAQRDALVECGSQRLQGYLFDKPLTSDELAQRLEKARS